MALFTDWLGKLNALLTNYSYDLSTAAGTKEMEIFEQISKIDNIEHFENVTIFFNYILTIRDVPAKTLRQNIKIKEKRNFSLESLNFAGSSTTNYLNYITSGSLVTIMDVNDNLEILHVRNAIPEATEQFLTNVIRVHVSHLKSPVLSTFPQVDGMYVTTYKKDDIWYRVKVIQVFQDKTYLVRFVDFGVVEKVHWSNLRQYNANEGSKVPFTYRHPVKLNYVFARWNTNIKRYLINLSKNYHNMFKIMFNHYGEPAILQPINNTVSLNETLTTFLSIPTQPQIEFKQRDFLIPQTEIMTILQKYDLPTISDIS